MSEQPKKKKRMVTVRCSEEQYQNIKDRAANLGTSMEQYMLFKSGIIDYASPSPERKSNSGKNSGIVSGLECKSRPELELSDEELEQYGYLSPEAEGSNPSLPTEQQVLDENVGSRIVRLPSNNSLGASTPSIQN